MSRISMLAVLSSLLVCCFLSGAGDLSESFMNAGLKKYLNGDIDGSIDMLKKSIDEDSGNTKAKNALLNVYVFQGKKLYTEKNYRSAKTYLIAALGVDANNAEAKQYLAKIEEVESKGMLKDYKPVEEKKSSIEAELDKKVAETAAAQKPLTKDDVAKKEEQYQKVIVQTESVGGASRESLDEFIYTLKEIKKQSTEENLAIIDKVSSIHREKEAVIQSANTMSRWYIIIIAAGVLIAIAIIAFLILRFYKFRVRMAEHSYQFTAEREAKILQVMNNVVNIDRGTPVTALPGAQNAEVVSIEDNSKKAVITIPAAAMELVKGLRFRDRFSSEQLDIDLTSNTAHAKANAILGLYFTNKQRMMELTAFSFQNEFADAELIELLIAVIRAVSDADAFSLFVDEAHRITPNSAIKDELRKTIARYESAGILSGEQDLLTRAQAIAAAWAKEEGQPA